MTALATVSDKELNSTRRCKQEIMNTCNNKKTTALLRNPTVSE